MAWLLKELFKESGSGSFRPAPYLLHWRQILYRCPTHSLQSPCSCPEDVCLQPEVLFVSFATRCI